MNYKTEINGIGVNVDFTDDNIENIFIPILKYANKLYGEKKKRVLILLAAPPGAGKSTLLSFFKYLSENNNELNPITTIGMDGFHRYQDYLLTHDMERDGKTYKMVELKGCPETFDLEKLLERTKKVANGETVGWPEYDRLTHNPVEDTIMVSGDIVFLEGNYLLLDKPGWKELKGLSDLTISIRADEGMLRDRLIQRKMKTGNISHEKAEKFVDLSDLYNAHTCLKYSVEADIVLDILSDNSYRLVKHPQFM